MASAIGAQGVWSVSEVSDVISLYGIVLGQFRSY
jgi:hypothetical protein